MVAESGKQALANGRAHGSGYSGLCAKYVREPCWRVAALYGSAIDQWRGATKKHPGDRNPPPGAPMYYEGGQYGHAVVSAGGGQIRSTDCTSANDISEVDVSWVEKNWGYRYLGWTGDLNGVDLPITGKDDDEVRDEDIEAIAKRVNQVLGDYTAEGKKREDAGPDPEQGDKRIRQIENTVRDIEAKVDKVLNKLT